MYWHPSSHVDEGRASQSGLEQESVEKVEDSWGSNMGVD